MSLPICQHCGSDDLIVVYQATVTQRANAISEVEPGVWHIDVYDSQEIEDGSYRHVVLECRACGGEVAKEGPTDTFRVPLKEGGA